MKIIHFAVVAMVSLVVISGLMIPMTSEFADEIHSVEINDTARYTLAETNKEINLEIIDGIGFVNGEALHDFDRYRLTMFTNNFIVNYDPATEPTGRFQIFRSDGTTAYLLSLMANGGSWTATTTTNTTLSGTYDFAMVWNKNGNYGAADRNSTMYVNNDAKIYFAAMGTNNDSALWSGTVTNLQRIFALNNAPSIELTKEIFTENPMVWEVSTYTITPVGENTTSGVYFAPMKYDTITSMDVMTKTIITLSPLFMGIALFAALGMGLVRMNKFD